MPYNLSPSLLARYFYFECGRYLRYRATPLSEKARQGIPDFAENFNPVTQSVLQAGYAWETELIGRLRKQGTVHIPPGKGALSKRAFPLQKSPQVIANSKEGEYVYQPELRPAATFARGYGLDPTLVAFGTCRPDILRVVDVAGKPAVRVIDIKASDRLKTSHRLQVAVYALVLDSFLRSQGIKMPVDLEQGGIWLYGMEQPEIFSLSESLGPLERFLRDELHGIFTRPVESVPWHVYYRCEHCDYFGFCKEQALEEQSVSLIPYLTPISRRFIREADWDKGKPVETLDDMKTLLARRDADDILDRCGSLRGRRHRLLKAIDALQQQKAVPHLGSSLALPKMEHVAIFLTVQQDPVSGQIYALGFRRFKGKDVYKDTVAEQYFVAPSLKQCRSTQLAFIQALLAELEVLHEYNAPLEWGAQKSLQCYVFDSLEADLFRRLLIEGLSDPKLARPAFRLLLFFHSEALIRTEGQPDGFVPYPLSALTDIIRGLFALPAPFAINLSAATEYLGNPQFNYKYRSNDLFTYQLSNAMKGEALYQLWHKNRKDAKQWIEQELRSRLLSASSLLDGIRIRVEDQLFNWARKFVFPNQVNFNHWELSCIRFIVQYESFMAALASRISRTGPLEERIRDGISIPVKFAGNGVWNVLAPLDPSILKSSTFPSFLLAPEGQQFEIEQMRYDDYRYRNKRFSPPKGNIWICAVSDFNPNPQTGLVQTLKVDVVFRNNHERIQKGQKALIHPRFWDYNSDRICDQIGLIDHEQKSDFLALIREPARFSAHFQQSQLNASSVKSLLNKSGFTKSQAAATRHLVSNRLTLVWGPPGTGKTHFLAKAICFLIRSKKQVVKQLRILVTAFTHAAIENLLCEIQHVARQIGIHKDIDLFKLDGVRTEMGKHLPELSGVRGLAHAQAPGLIVGGTVYGIRKIFEKKSMVPFDVLLIDEGSQLKLGETVLAMLGLRDGGRLVIAGDDLQLPPIINGVYPEPEDGLPGLHDSIFAYLRARVPKNFTKQLLENWRMNLTLNRYPAETLYGTGYKPARTDIGAQRIRLGKAAYINKKAQSFVDWALEPQRPLVVCMIEGIRTGAGNLVEAGLVALLAIELRNRLLQDGSGKPWPATEQGDCTFWQNGLFIVSPHHAQINLIRQGLLWGRKWNSPPFVDTVDKMQGQQCQTVLISYGVSDVETALQEAEFIYSLNRLNVSVTRAKAKCIVFLPRPLLEPTLEVFENEKAARGLQHMHDLVSYCEEGGESRRFNVAWANAGDEVWLRGVRR